MTFNTAEALNYEQALAVMDELNQNPVSEEYGTTARLERGDYTYSWSRSNSESAVTFTMAK